MRLRIPLLLRGKTFRKGRPGDSEGNREVLTFFPPCRIATWPIFGDLIDPDVNAAISLAIDGI